MKRMVLVITMIVALTLNLCSTFVFADDNNVQTVEYTYISKTDAQVLEKAADTIKITSNAEQDAAPGINFKWADKQNSNCLLTVQPSVFEKYESFTVLLNDADEYVYVYITAPGTYSLPKFVANGEVHDINMAWICKFAAKAQQIIFNRIVVFEDANRNGIFDAGEQPISNVKVAFNNLQYSDPNIVLTAYSDTKGKVEYTLPGNVTNLKAYYFELLEIPAGYQMSPEANSFFGQDNRSCPRDIEIANNEVISFGSAPMVYIPLLPIKKATFEVVTANYADHSIVYKGVSYELYQQYKLGPFIKIDTQVSDENGICRFYNIDTEFNVYIRATNLTELGLKPYEFLGPDCNSGYIKLKAPQLNELVTLSEI